MATDGTCSGWGIAAPASQTRLLMLGPQSPRIYLKAEWFIKMIGLCLSPGISISSLTMTILGLYTQLIRASHIMSWAQSARSPMVSLKLVLDAFCMKWVSNRSRAHLTSCFSNSARVRTGMSIIIALLYNRNSSTTIGLPGGLVHIVTYQTMEMK